MCVESFEKSPSVSVLATPVTVTDCVTMAGIERRDVREIVSLLVNLSYDTGLAEHRLRPKPDSLLQVSPVKLEKC